MITAKKINIKSGWLKVVCKICNCNHKNYKQDNPENDFSMFFSFSVERSYKFPNKSINPEISFGLRSHSFKV